MAIFNQLSYCQTSWMAAITKITEMATKMANNMKADQRWPPMVPSTHTRILSCLMCNSF